MNGIELFSGAGGMGLGAKNAGINIKIAVEKNSYAAQTYLHNHSKTTVVVDDIENIQEFNFSNKNDDQTVLFGGPPCQGYSTLNRKTRNQKNSKNWLFLEFMRSVELIKPDWVVIENVPGLKNMDSGFFLEMICDQLQEHGYTPNVTILNAADFGVPQIRERLFIVGSRDRIAFEFPIGNYRSKHVTVGEALSDLPILKNGEKTDLIDYKNKAVSNYSKRMRKKSRKASQNFVSKNSNLILERYRHIKQGNNWKDIPNDLMTNYKDHKRCHHNIYRRLSLNEPACVIANYRKSMIVHPTENRGLSIREAARLQSFPDNYFFKGPLTHIQQQVGDAVPPILAEAIFRRIKELN